MQARTRADELQALLHECDISLAALQAEHNTLTVRLTEISNEMEAMRLKRKEISLALSSQPISDDMGSEDALNSAEIEKSVQKLLDSVNALHHASQKAVFKRPKKGCGA